MQSSNSIDSIPQLQANPSMASPTNISQSPSIEISQISSPPLPPLPQVSGGQISLSQSQQLQGSPTVGLDYQKQQQQQFQQQQIQQQQNMINPSNYQIQQSLQRSPSMSRLNLQQQQQLNVMRQGIYGQMNFGGSSLQQQQQNQQQQQQQQIGTGNLSRSALMGQSSHLPVLSSQAAVAAAQLNMQSQLLASV